MRTYYILRDRNQSPIHRPYSISNFEFCSTKTLLSMYFDNLQPPVVFYFHRRPRTRHEVLPHANDKLQYPFHMWKWYHHRRCLKKLSRNLKLPAYHLFIVSFLPSKSMTIGTLLDRLVDRSRTAFLDWQIGLSHPSHPREQSAPHGHSEIRFMV